MNDPQSKQSEARASGEEAASGRGYTSLKAFVVSDVHLNNHPYDRHKETENPRRQNFREFLTRINQEMAPQEKVLIILNGDILDITGSWFEPIMPWNKNEAVVETILEKLLHDIVDNNLATFQELRRFLQHPHAEIIYIFGNHDGLLQEFPASQSILRDFLCASPSSDLNIPESDSPIQLDESISARLRFEPFYVSKELDLYIEHGHLLDPFNHSQSDQPPLGDVINILVVNRFVELTVSRLRSQGYSEEFISRMHAQLHDIEYLRPLALVPVWIETIARQHDRHPENIGKQRSIRDILISVVAKTLQNPQMTRYLIHQLRLPRPILYFMIKLTMRLPATLPLLSFITSRLVRRTHSNKYQYKAAQKIYKEHGARLIAFGHTHIPAVQPLSENAYYFNTGSWKPVINIFKYSKEDLVELEYLNPDVQFNKVERSGILKLEKHDVTSHHPAEFSLQTIQSGLS